GVRYHEVHIYRLLHKWGFSPKVPRKRFVNTASNKEKKQFKKKAREIISSIPKDFTVAVEDESILISLEDCEFKYNHYFEHDDECSSL
ncbi:MAG: winged helix-turn-helix domain-containing protein, partial [Candidatus Nitrosopolaris sp.]